nr:hypothetical protein CFP56_70582 [Quercus suber]
MLPTAMIAPTAEQSGLLIKDLQTHSLQEKPAHPGKAPGRRTKKRHIWRELEFRTPKAGSRDGRMLLAFAKHLLVTIPPPCESFQSMEHRPYGETPSPPLHAKDWQGRTEGGVYAMPAMARHLLLRYQLPSPLRISILRFPVPLRSQAALPSGLDNLLSRHQHNGTRNGGILTRQCELTPSHITNVSWVHVDRPAWSASLSKAREGGKQGGYIRKVRAKLIMRYYSCYCYRLLLLQRGIDETQEMRGAA